MIQAAVGSIFTQNGADYSRVARGESGFAIYGPYMKLGPGEYVISFSLLGRAKAADLCFRIDVSSNNGDKILAARQIFGAELNDELNTIDMTFTVEQSSHFEFRAFASGLVQGSIGNRVLAAISGLQPNRIAVLDGATEIYHAQASMLMECFSCGAEVTPHGKGALVKFPDVTIVVDSKDDLQVIDEIFVHNTYNVIPIRNCIVIDVGMNIGAASLFFASKAWCTKVYAFEPFPDTFDRALSIFELNKEIGTKIVPNNFGLSGADDELEVKFEPGHAISTSVRGRDSGNTRKIVLKDAAVIFRDIIDEASRDGCGVVAKIDCEGSEFPIFSRLGEAGLFSRIDAFVIEWHKWWSHDTSVDDLLRPLRENGFVVMDHTVPSDPWAGNLYAVRTSRPA